jgi:hypothetical protein
VVLPDDLLADIDALVGSRGRSAFIAEIARKEVRRLRLMNFLDSKEPAWRSEDHPELKSGAAKWVHEMRRNDQKLDLRRRPRSK